MVESRNFAFGERAMEVATEMAAKLYTAFTGDMPLEEFGLEWAPLLSTVVLPFLCVLFAIVGLISAKMKKSAGQRVMKKIMFGVKANVRMVRSGSPKKAGGGKGKAAGAMEKGKAAGKGKPSPPGGKGGRFY